MRRRALAGPRASVVAALALAALAAGAAGAALGAGAGLARAAAIHHRGAEIIMLNAAGAAATTRMPVEFIGSVPAADPRQAVLLQERDSAYNDGWRTLAHLHAGADCTLMFAHRFTAPGDYTLRAYVPGGSGRPASASAQIPLGVQQSQNRTFTISGTPALAIAGQAVEISGVLLSSSGPATPQRGMVVTLYGRGGHRWLRRLATARTSAAGAYAFTRTPKHNAVYVVKAATAAGGRQRTTSPLYVGVARAVRTRLSRAGGELRLHGNVTPGGVGSPIYLQEVGAVGQWRNLARARLGPHATYAFTHAIRTGATLQLRVYLPASATNMGAGSSLLTVGAHAAAARSGR